VLFYLARVDRKDAYEDTVSAITKGSPDPARPCRQYFEVNVHPPMADRLHQERLRMCEKP
jgi:hypothetical protein